jgi:glutaredoxin-like YruB-family protein
MILINSRSELLEILQRNDVVYVLIHKSGSETSDCAFNNIQEAFKNYKGKNQIATVDVNKLLDIHKHYNVTSAPSLLVFNKGELQNIIKGCMDTAFYSSLHADKLKNKSASGDSGKKQKNVTLYSTPSCSWCTKIKEHLRANNIHFREIDVAANPKMAEVMKSKSGQLGVPQTDINGQMIVGFDRPKIDKLLEIS